MCRTVPGERLLGRGEELLGEADCGHPDHLLGARLGLAAEAGQVLVLTTDRFGNRTL